LLVVRSGDHLMGDAFTTKERPTLSVVVRGTTPVARLRIVRNDQYVYSTEPKTTDVSLIYQDDDARPGQTYYYYVRAEQADGNLAWGSPIWITYEK